MKQVLSRAPPQVNPGLEAQAAARIYRLGQQRPTRVIRLLAHNTVRLCTRALCRAGVSLCLVLVAASVVCVPCGTAVECSHVTAVLAPYHGPRHACMCDLSMLA